MVVSRARVLREVEKAIRILAFGLNAVMLMVALQGGIRLVTAPLSTTQYGVAGSATGAAIDIVLIALLWILGATFLGASLTFVRRRQPPLGYAARRGAHADAGWVPAPRSGPRNVRPVR